LPDALRRLGDRGVNRLLVEGGAQVATAFLEAGLVDEWQLFRSPSALGKGAVAAPLEALSAFRPVATEMLGADSLTVYHPR
jgi:diaminohydroxyphosphoribosylaminopyrimidine deaminase/5-amino-6-(5-phosphoribosylamino)uracil reductase